MVLDDSTHSISQWSGIKGACVCFELTRWIGLIAVHWPADPGERVDFEGEMVSSVLNK